MAKGLGTVYDSLSTLLAAGVPLIRSLKTVSAGLRGNLQQAFLQITESIPKGLPLTDAMAMHPKVFAQLDIMIIRAAEESGNLPESFERLGEWHEFSKRIRRRLIVGLFLPIFVIHLAAFLPPLPRLILAGWDVEAYFRSVLLTLAIPYVLTALVIGVIRFTPQTGTARRALDRFSLKIPALGRGRYKLALSRYCWIFHMTSKAGMPISEGADLAIKGTGIAVVADLFRPAAASVKAGNPFTEGLSPKLPPEFIEPWRIGEETGKLDDISKKLAEQNAEASEFWFKQFADWFPRFVYVTLLLIMAAIVIHRIVGVYGQILSF